MTKFILGVVLGFALATVGVSGVARVISKGVTATENVVKGASDGSLDSSVNKAKEIVTDATK